MLLTEFGLAGSAPMISLSASATVISAGSRLPGRWPLIRHFLLLDEPAAGMNEVETTGLLAVLEELPRSRGLSLLIIDHDMGLIMRLCERLHVLASGRTIAEGDKDSVRADPVVIEAYLGTGAEATAHA